jgi:hypothetical protein
MPPHWTGMEEELSSRFKVHSSCFFLLLHYCRSIFLFIVHCSLFIVHCFLFLEGLVSDSYQSSLVGITMSQESYRSSFRWHPPFISFERVRLVETSSHLVSHICFFFLSLVCKALNLTVEEFIREYEIPGKPVIITDAMKDWPANQNWTLSALLKKYRHVKVLLHSEFCELTTPFFHDHSN